jgi:pimeloyl-ACP methyl ester carboxylesterase
MSNEHPLHRRGGLATDAVGLVASELSAIGPVRASEHPKKLQRLGPIQQVKAGVLDVGYLEIGASAGPPVLLLHGFPYDIHSYVDVAPMLAARGCRVIVPHLRGHGTTRFRDSAVPRSGQQAAFGADVIDLMDALNISRAVLAGYDWGGRAACVAAALWPERCTGLVSANGYLIHDAAHAEVPLAAQLEAALWYQYYFQTERGRAGLTANRRDIAKLLWTQNSPGWHYDDATFERSAEAFDNPDYVDVVIHAYRHRLGLAPGYPQYAELEQQLASQPTIPVPTITLEGDADGGMPATDRQADAHKFSAEREHRVLPQVGHNLPQENPSAFADAVWELASG